MNIDVIKKNMLKNEAYLSKYACLDEDAIRLKKYNVKEEIRGNYFRDIDRIIYSLSYMRYIDKTQVFSNINNDHISRRIIHVQMVSKIARTIGRALNLNEDLIEAIALGHDIGHVPFGHVGESILNDISLKHGEGIFMHNVQSVRNMMYIEKHGEGINLTLQTLDGILCHNGEQLESKYIAKPKTKEEFLDEYNLCYKSKENIYSLVPMTLEGAVVRISDIVAYIGRDIEDAIRLGIIKKSDISSDIAGILGTTNKQIINTLVLDIINNSYNKPYIKLSDAVLDSLNKLIKFNYNNIYYKANSKDKIDEYKKMFNELFDNYLMEIKSNNKDSDIFTMYLNDMTKTYLENTTDERKVIDYIAGMTDAYFLKQYQNIKK